MEKRLLTKFRKKAFKVLPLCVSLMLEKRESAANGLRLSPASCYKAESMECLAFEKHVTRFSNFNFQLKQKC